MENKNFDIIIIGGGPAGCSAAVYSASRGKKVAVLEKNKIGGTVGNVSSVTHFLSVENEETGVSFAKKLEDQLIKYKVPVINEEAIDFQLDGDIKKVITKDSEYLCSCVILATGLTPKNLDVPGVERFLNNGIYKNASQYGEKFEGKDIYVVGGADGAIKEAIYLAQFAKKLTIIHFENSLNPIAEFKEKLKELPNVEVILNSKITNLIGDEKLEKIEITNVENGEKILLDADGCGIFPYIGGSPMINEKLNLNLENGFLSVNSGMETNIPGVFGAGDICAKTIRQVSTAVSDGTIAGVKSSLYIK